QILQADEVSSGLPAPTGRSAVHPVAGVEWEPAPRIRRNPGVTNGWVIRPHTVVVGTPCRRGEVGPPEGAAARHVDEASIVVQIARTIERHRAVGRTQV